MLTEGHSCWLGLILLDLLLLLVTNLPCIIVVSLGLKLSGLCSHSFFEPVNKRGELSDLEIKYSILRLKQINFDG